MEQKEQNQQQREIGVCDNDSMGMFLYAIRAEETRRQYLAKLKAFFDYLELQGTIEEQGRQFVSIHLQNSNWTSNALMRFINFQKNRVAKREITEATLRNYYKPIKLFCEMNDIQLGWKKIAKGIPRARNAGNDRAPTIEEIRALCNYPDRRIKPIIYTMVSSGIRLGAWDYLRWGDIDPIIKDEAVVAAKLLVYRGDAEEYLTFMTSEAYRALKEWMDLRAQSGEKTTKESWVMRDIWNAERYHHGFVSKPVKLKSSGIKRLIERALWAQGIREPLKEGRKRHEFKTDHGFRKYFKTRAEQYMRPINVEILMGHTTGISDSYYRPTEKELAEDYAKAADSLTVESSTRLAKEIAALKEDMKDSPRLEAIQQSLASKDLELDALKKELASRPTMDLINKMFTDLYKMELNLKMKEK